MKNKVNEKFIELINQSLKEEFIDFYSILEVYDKEILADKKIQKNIATEYIDRNEDYKKAKRLFAQGDSFVQQKMFNDASKQYQKGLSIYPHFFTARLNLGYVYRELGRHELSLNTYLEGIKLNGEELLLYTNIARWASPKILDTFLNAS